MRKKIKEALLFLVIQCAMYFLITINQRGVVEYNYSTVILTDIAIASMGFFIVKKIANSAESFHQLVGYVTGGVIGSVVALYLSQNNII